MATQQEEIAGRIGLDATPFAVTLRGLTGQIQAFATKAAAAVGGIFVFSRLVGFGKSILDFADKIQASADQMGTSVEFLQGFTFAASQTGSTAEKSAKNLEFFTRKIGEAMAGSAEAIAIFERLNITLLDNQGKSKGIEDIYRQVANAVAKLSDPTLQANAAFELFGKGSAALIPLLKSGATGFDDLSASINKLTTEEVDLLDRAGDRIVAFWTRIKVAAAQAAVHVGTGGFLNARGRRLFGFPELDPETLENIKHAALPLPGGRNPSGETAAAIDKERKANIDAAVKEARIKDEAQRKELEFLRTKERKIRDITKIETELENARQDRLKFTLQELASSNPNAFRGGLRQDILRAQQVLLLERRAAQRARFGFADPAGEDLALADQIRGQIRNAVERERRPFANIEDRLKEQREELHEINGRLAGKDGKAVPIIPFNGE